MSPPRSASASSSSSSSSSTGGVNGSGNGDGDGNSNSRSSNDAQQQQQQQQQQQPDYIQDLMTLSDSSVRAYQADNLAAMDATLNPTTTGTNTDALHKLEFYALPLSWLQRAWPILYPQSHRYNFDSFVDESWREQIGIIENAQLLVLPSISATTTATATATTTTADGDEDKEEEDDGTAAAATTTTTTNHIDSSTSSMNSTIRTKAILEQAMKRRQRQQQQAQLQHQQQQQDGQGQGQGRGQSQIQGQGQQQQQLKLKPHLKHSKDFVFIGKNVWMIIKEKFGYDGYEIRRTCVHVPSTSSNSTISNSTNNCDGDNNDNDLSQVGIELLPGEATGSGEMTSIPVAKTTTTTTEEWSSSFSSGSTTKERRVRVIRLPASSRFPYEKYVVAEKEASSSSSSSSSSSYEKEKGRDEMDDIYDEKSNDSRREQQQQQQEEDNNTKKTNEGENEDEDEDENQFSAMNSRVIPSKSDDSKSDVPPSTNNDDSQQRAIICLPNSTTSFGRDSPTASDAMDVDSTARSATTGGTPRRFSGRKRLSSGLGNLGNTCFMNSTLQCLARTDPIRQYFLSGEFKSDLNRDNPLGTHGQLAEEFANLMCEMWGKPSKKRNVLSYQNSYANNYYSWNNSGAVYPREFKTCLGRHASQFMGYDQHDSQEFATYLLDALHEDTNKITKKPYVEKPEQGEDETDEEAAQKAWDLHLRREDSRMMEYLMGQVKSKLECCEEGCNRVSTTFDPFMFLSVPIPGSNNRQLEIVFVPLDPSKRRKTVSLTVAKYSSFKDMFAKELNDELMKIGLINETIPHENLCAIDLMGGKAWKVYKNDDSISSISDSDHTAVYELEPVKALKDDNQMDLGDADKSDRQTRLDKAVLEKLDHDGWQSMMLDSYVVHRLGCLRYFNPTRASQEECKEFKKKIDDFVEDCYGSLSNEDNDSTGGLKRAREEATEGAVDDMLSSPSSSSSPKISSFEEKKESVSVDDRLVECSAKSDTFSNVKSVEDLAILQECSKKFGEYIDNDCQLVPKSSPDPIIIEVRIGKKSLTAYSNAYFGKNPIMLRLPGNTTIYELRGEVAARLSRCLNSAPPPETKNNMDETDVSTNGMEFLNHSHGSSSESFRLDILRMARLSVKTGGSNPYSYSVGRDPTLPLGMIRHSSDENALATADDPEERKTIAASIGDGGAVKAEWDNKKIFDLLDEQEYDSEADLDNCMDDCNDETKLNKDEDDGVITLEKCIRKYCQKEQLEETEMWYCSKCQKHVRAWKQFHLFRAPPILIIQLKRFSYTAHSFTHRRDKISSLVHFPLEGLDLTEFVPFYSEDEKPVYDCYAVSNHFGSCGGGHYTAYILGEDGSWCYYDDSSVQENQDALKVVSEAAYVLYYRRRDLPAGREDEVVVDPRASSPMLVEEEGSNDPTKSENDLSSNGAQAGDLDDTMDTHSNSSSRTAADGSREPSVGPLYDDDVDDAGVPSGVVITNTDNFPPQ